MAEEKTYLSVIVPFHDEADSLPAFVRRFDEVFASFEKRFELVFVDDGSADSGPDFVKSLIAERRNVRLIRLDGRYGRDAAVCAGLRYADGDFKAVIPADLQYDPAELMKLVSALDADPAPDMVAGFLARPERDYEPHRRGDIPRYDIAVGGRLRDPLCSLRIYSRSLVDRAQSYFGNTYSPMTLLPRMSKVVGQVEVKRSPRAAGKDKNPAGALAAFDFARDDGLKDRLAGFRYFSMLALVGGVFVAFTSVLIAAYIFGSLGDAYPPFVYFGRRLSLGFLVTGFFGGLALTALATAVRKFLPALLPVPEPVRYRTAEILSASSRSRRRRRPRRRSRKPSGGDSSADRSREGSRREGKEDKQGSASKDASRSRKPDEPPPVYTGPVTLESIVSEEKRTGDSRRSHARGRRNSSRGKGNGK